MPSDLAPGQPRHSAVPDAPTYEGRPLDHPDEPVVDQGLRFDIGTLMSRRRSLAVLGGGAAALGLAACGASSSEDAADGSAASDGGGSTTSEGEIPDETAGPYPGDGSNGPDVLSESGVVRQDIRSSFGTGSATATGVPMTLTLSLTDLSREGAAYSGVAVYVWHCTGDGQYSMYADGLEQENYLRGVQVAGDDGTVTFTSIYPGCYSGRWPHIHFEVYPDEASITSTDTLLATSQVALPQAISEGVYATAGYDGSAENLAAITLDSDNVFGDDGGELQLADAEGDVTTGYTVTLPVAIDPDTAPQAGQAPSGSGGGPGGGESGGPGGGGEPPEGAPGGTPLEGAPSDGGGAANGALVGSR